MTSSAFARTVAGAVRGALEPLADPTRAEPMRAYMKDVAPFLGVSTPDRRNALRPLIRQWHPSESELGAAARELWDMPEREFHYAACDLIAAKNKVLAAPFLTKHGEYLLTTVPWWDTVDALGSGMVTPVVARNQGLVALMWRWLESDDRWLVRAAIQHQRGLKSETDVQRLVEMCDARSHDKEFFIAKAVGWALRDLAVIDRTAAEHFLVEHPDLPAVAKRELVRGLNR